MNFESLIIVMFSLSMTVIVFAQVVMRYVFNSAFPWAEELSRYLFIWIIYLGISYSCRTRRHVRVMFALKRMPETMRRIVIILGDVLFVCYCAIVVIYGIRLNINTYRLGQYAAAIRISYVFVYMSIVVGAFLSAVRLVQNIINKIQNWHAPFEKFERLEAGNYLFKERGVE